MGGAMLVLSVVLASVAPPIAGPIDPVARVILALAVVLVGAKLGGEIAERLGQPAVLGELLAGILLGNLELVGVSWVGSIPADATIDVLAKLGAVLLLFEVGLESTVGDIMKVGGRAFTVATLGERESPTSVWRSCLEKPSCSWWVRWWRGGHCRRGCSGSRGDCGGKGSCSSPPWCSVSSSRTWLRSWGSLPSWARTLRASCSRKRTMWSWSAAAAARSRISCAPSRRSWCPCFSW